MSSYLKPIWGNLQNPGNLKFLPTSTILNCKELENQSCQLMPFTTQRIPELHSLHWNQQWHVFYHLLHHRKHPTNTPKNPHTVNVWFDPATGICNEIAARLWVYLAWSRRVVGMVGFCMWVICQLTIFLEALGTQHKTAWFSCIIIFIYIYM